MATISGCAMATVGEMLNLFLILFLFRCSSFFGCQESQSFVCPLSHYCKIIQFYSLLFFTIKVGT